MKTEGRYNGGEIVVDFYCGRLGKAGGTSLCLDEAMRARELLLELIELIPAKDYQDLVADLDKAMLAADEARLQAFKMAEVAA